MRTQLGKVLKNGDFPKTELRAGGVKYLNFPDLFGVPKGLRNFPRKKNLFESFRQQVRVRG